MLYDYEDTGPHCLLYIVLLARCGLRELLITTQKNSACTWILAIYKQIKIVINIIINS